ncbi:hypothetical protein I8748_29325 [Nostoc sp. CENA67]|uniref:Uncharacterized protein n=1 Tax=Amazonocrinis nigriterrae CENA67 TaxID=2794033 RepID=A0A8J7HV71_9NOST|nr:hypothetical protein [Amazonocrinis nigriterrae]MBH8566212.1 hypothetical protein [Amazonocrinis nigriterrae CENA67]
MKQMISRFRQIIVVFLVGFTFLLGQGFSFVSVAQADVTTPEGIYYKGTPDDWGQNRNQPQQRQKLNDSQGSSYQGSDSNAFKDAANAVRDKLNLDEETPGARREFFDSGRNKATKDSTVRTPEGIYYKGTPDDRGEVRNDTQIRNAQNKLKGAVDNVREKLNLEEETPRATREFFNSEKNITNENKEGYYQNPPSRQLRDRT